MVDGSAFPSLRRHKARGWRLVYLPPGRAGLLPACFPPPWARGHPARSSSHSLLGGPGKGRATTRVAPTSFIGRVMHMRWWSCSGCSVGAIHELPPTAARRPETYAAHELVWQAALAVPLSPASRAGQALALSHQGRGKGPAADRLYRNVRTSPSRGEGRELVGATLVVAQLPLFFAGSAGILPAVFCGLPTHKKPSPPWRGGRRPGWVPGPPSRGNPPRR